MSFNIAALAALNLAVLDRHFAEVQDLFESCRDVQKTLRAGDQFAAVTAQIEDFPGSDDEVKIALDRAPETIKGFEGQRESLLVTYKTTITDNGFKLRYSGSVDMTPPKASTD